MKKTTIFAVIFVLIFSFSLGFNPEFAVAEEIDQVTEINEIIEEMPEDLTSAQQVEVLIESMLLQADSGLIDIQVLESSLIEQDLDRVMDQLIDLGNSESQGLIGKIRDRIAMTNIRRTLRKVIINVKAFTAQGYISPVTGGEIVEELRAIIAATGINQ